jgi:hypothetical protein
MNKKELIDKLNKIYNDIESSLEDETIMTIGKRINRLNDDLGSVIQDIEDINGAIEE